MVNQTRDEHLAWCKARALEYLNRPEPDVSGAVGSLIADLGKHTETAQHFAREMGVLLLMGGHLSTVQQARDFIEGCN